MELVLLTDPELDFVKYIAKLRLRLYRELDDRSSVEYCNNLRSHENSFGAELAVAKFLNVYPDLNMMYGPRPTFDLTCRGVRIDVKCTDKSNGNLIIPHLDKRRTYLLTVGIIPTYHLIGFIDGHEVEVRGKFDENLPRPAWFVSRYELKDIQELRG